MSGVTYKEIDRVEILGTSSCTVYDIQLEKNHLFFANGIATHNCRLRNELEENDFSFSLGGGGVETGSTSVMTLNLPRIAQNSLLKHLKEKKSGKGC